MVRGGGGLIIIEMFEVLLIVLEVVLVDIM